LAKHLGRTLFGDTVPLIAVTPPDSLPIISFRGLDEQLASLRCDKAFYPPRAQLRYVVMESGSCLLWQ
jgi:hypothetical protein